MIKRIVEISRARTHLSIRYGQLIVKQNGEQVSSIPCEDIGVLLVDHSGVTYTHSGEKCANPPHPHLDSSNYFKLFSAQPLVVAGLAKQVL